MAVTQVLPMASNFLVPNGTFFVELIAFVAMFYILAKFVIPPINRAMTARQDAIRAQFAEDIEANSVHGSDSAENAANEIAFFFAGVEIVG